MDHYKEPVKTLMIDNVICGDALTTLKTLPNSCIQSIITSPPYYKQRDYNIKNQIGQETVIDEYLNSLIEVFIECKRVLKDTGSLWINIGDKYINNELLGIPWTLALQLKQSWILRSDIIWHKPNAMPSSVKGRPTTDHEYIFLFVKQLDYYYNNNAIREPHVTFSEESKMRGGRNHLGKKGSTPENGKYGGKDGLHNGDWDTVFNPLGRNKRTVWSIPLSKFKGSHFAVFPEKLVETCILASTQEEDIVLDPFFGSGTTGVVAKRLNRHYIGIDLNQEYCEMAKSRIKEIQPQINFI